MRVAVLSDLHLESGDYSSELPPADYIVLPGDIVSSHPHVVEIYDKFIRRAYATYGEDHVLELDGNHTGYGASIDAFSHRQYCLIDGDFAFIGATLWSGKKSAMAYTVLNDKHIIGFTWDWMRDRHDKDLAFIERSLKEHKDKRCIVFTHHLPSLECVDKKWLENGIGGINFGFYSDLDWVLNKYAPEVWISGHTHDSYDKTHSNGKTRLVCNPRGYMRLDGTFENIDFDPSKILVL